jgi:hypothetical protein
MAAAALAGGPYAVFARLGDVREQPHVVEATVGQAKFALPSRFLRASSPRDGATSALKAAVFFPGFTPAGDFDDVTAETDLDRRLAEMVFIVIKPADASLDPADHTARLYERFLEDDAWSHPGGLIARAFADDSPFRGDELYFVAPEGREFAARCRKPSPAAKTQNICLAEMRMGDVDVELRFAAALLGEWRALCDGARGLIASARR